MIYIDTENYRKKQDIFDRKTSVEELYAEKILEYYPDDDLTYLVDFFKEIGTAVIDVEKQPREVFKQLILLQADGLKQLCEDYEKIGKDLNQFQLIKKNAVESVKKIYTEKKRLSNPIITNQKNINQFLVDYLGITVCPYCNRNFINNRGDKFSAQMDHFYSKDVYPFLAVSLYNLIPTCGACNHIKSTQDFHIHPFLKPTQESDFTFDYQLSSVDDIEIKISASDSRKNDFEAIRLEKAYQIHITDVQNMLDREEKYSKGYRKELQEIFKGDDNEGRILPLVDDEIDRMIYGDVIFEEDIKNISLGKFKKDIYQQIKSLRGY